MSHNWRDNLKNQQIRVISSESRPILIYMVKLLELNTPSSWNLNDIQI